MKTHINYHIFIIYVESDAPQVENSQGKKSTLQMEKNNSLINMSITPSNNSTIQFGRFSPPSFSLSSNLYVFLCLHWNIYVYVHFYIHIFTSVYLYIYLPICIWINTFQINIIIPPKYTMITCVLHMHKFAKMIVIKIKCVLADEFDKRQSEVNYLR